MTSFDYHYQNAFRCNLCNDDLCHARAILHTHKNIGPQGKYAIRSNSHREARVEIRGRGGGATDVSSEKGNNT